MTGSPREDLLRRLTERVPAFGAWKNVDSALGGSGDLDVVAPAAAWDVVEGTFREWAAATGFDDVVACRHTPGALILIAVARDGAQPVELDVRDRLPFRGSVLTSAERLQELMEIDHRGFRRLRAGAEGLMLLVYNGTLRGGRPNQDGLRRRNVAELLSHDPDGVAAAAAVFGVLRGTMTRAAAAAAAGSWDRSGLLLIELRATARVLLGPRWLAGRVRFHLVSRRRCPVLASVGYRRIGPDVGSWLARARATHETREALS